MNKYNSCGKPGLVIRGVVESTNRDKRFMTDPICDDCWGMFLDTIFRS